MKFLPESMEIYMTSKCNLRCEYCYISKNNSLVLHDKEIEQCHKDLIYLNKIKELYKENKDALTSLSLWGGEPTMGLNRITETFDEYVNYFPKLNRISFSTNMTYGNKNIYDFLDKLSLYENRSFLIDLQISIDGPSEINNYNRKGYQDGVDINEIIVQNTLDLIKYFNEKNYLNVVVRQHFKPTINMDIINKFLTTEESIISYYKYFEEIHDLFKKNNDSLNMLFQRPTLPNIAVPGEYTSQDGKDFAAFVRRCKNVEKRNQEEKLFHYYDKLIWFEEHVYFTRKMMESGEIEQCFCGACKGQACIDSNGKLHLCHRGFLDSNDNYIEESCKKQDISVFQQTNKEYTLSKKLTSFDFDKCINDEEYVKHLNDVRKSDGLRIASALSIIYEMALCGQVSEIFLESKKMRMVGALFMLRAENCLQDAAMVTGSYYLKNPSLIKLYLNGVIDDIYKKDLLSGERI